MAKMLKALYKQQFHADTSPISLIIKYFCGVKSAQ